MLGRFTALNGISTRRRSVELDRLMGIASVRTRENLEFSTRRDTDSAVRPATISEHARVHAITLVARTLKIAGVVPGRRQRWSIRRLERSNS